MAWMVLIEQLQGSGDRIRWALSSTHRESGVEAGPFERFEEAAEEALRLTGSHQPAHPWSERERRAYRISPSEYVVNVVGATNDFHFRVSVAEVIVPGGSGFPAEGKADQRTWFG